MFFDKLKKGFIYEVDPLFFQDGNNDGFGDFNGFIKRIDYLKSLNIDAILFPDLFNQENKILKPLDITIFDKYGNLKEFKMIIEWFKENDIDFMMEINFNNILNSNMNRHLGEDEENQNILIKNKKDNNENDKMFETNFELFQSIIKFWQKNGIKNFVLTNFELSTNSQYTLDDGVINNLTKIYKWFKSEFNSSNLLLKSHLYSYK